QRGAARMYSIGTNEQTTLICDGLNKLSC
ncbi:hypothetical protein Q8G10_26805, partial [Klebsiella pneumoniae]|nr:hypothetical protein [Klebsiella pneumoniae]